MQCRPLKTEKPPITKKILIWLLLVIVSFFILVLLLTPLRNWGSKKYLESGDKKLLELSYIEAEIEYQKAAILTPLNATANARTNLAIDAETNLLVLRDFFQQYDQRSALNDLKAVDDETDPAKLIALSRDFINREQPAMAVIAARKSTSLKDNYRDGLLYLAIAYDRAARVETIRQESADFFSAESERYLELAHQSDPAYFATYPN